LPVPGATVTATHGTKKVTTFTDQGGAYSFADLADGAWKIEIEMQCFAPLQGEVTIAAQMPAARWEMKLLPAEQIKAHVQTAKTPVSATTPALHAAKPKNPDADAPEQP